ncbi:hypothetical protein ABK040_016197 [Willaertia magna]
MGNFASVAGKDVEKPTRKPTSRNPPVNNPPPINPEEILISKLKKGNKQANAMQEDELREWARSLCIPDEVKEWYLNPEFAQTVNQYEKLEKVQANVYTNNQSSTLFPTSTSESVPQSTESKSDTDDIFAIDDIDYNIDDIKKEAKQPFMQVGNKIKIKLIIAEICKSDTQRALRKMLSPVLTKLDFQQQFGMFHSALVVGPWYLEWNNSSICIPRKCYSSAAMVAADLEFKGMSTFDLNETIDKISKVIIDWNVNKEYSQRNANCQQFVDDLCKALGIPIQFDGVLGDYLNDLRSKGQCEIYFPVSDNMKEEFGIKESKVYFHTHEELDNFVKGLLEKQPLFAEEYNLDWNLLKSFDRAFWLRHFRHGDDPKFQPAGGLPDNCPFGDPTMTASFKKEWF